VIPQARENLKKDYRSTIEKLPCVSSSAQAVPAIASGLVPLSVHTVEREINQQS
jgi:hypothetical protein